MVVPSLLLCLHLNNNHVYQSCLFSKDFSCGLLLHKMFHVQSYKLTHGNVPVVCNPLQDLLSPNSTDITTIYIIKRVMSVYLFVCMQAMAGRTAGLIKTKLGIGTLVDPGSVSVKVKVKVMWCHLVNANKTPDRGPQGPREFEREER